MLVLSRKMNEKIQIGDSITITIIRLRNKNTVSIGIEAPSDVRVLRSELTPHVLSAGGPMATDAPHRGVDSPQLSERGENRCGTSSGESHADGGSPAAAGRPLRNIVENVLALHAV